MSTQQDYGKAANFVRIDFEGRAKPLMVFGASRQAFASVRVGIIRISAKNVVQWWLGGRCLGRVRGILDQGGKAFASVAALSVAEGGAFTSAQQDERLVDCEILRALAYTELGPYLLKVLTPA